MDIAISELLFIVPLVSMVVLIPISVNGIGVQESAYIFYLELAGAPTTNALIVSILARVVMVVFTVIGGIFYAVDGEKSWHKVLTNKIS